ncbi:MAG TPA: flagellar basal body P-ring protein FlgI [Bryobacteraceae bacterium]|jgi:flagellar P-ring protein precursor FlgI
MTPSWVGLLLLAVELQTPSTRLKELVSLEGVRDNQLIGYGLVVGLAGTGDRQLTVFSAQSLTNLLQQMGVSVPATAILVKNTAAVLVTATLPPFAQSGMHIDVTAAAMGDASNLQGGLLILTSLKAVDGQVYAVAQGSVVTGGFGAGRGGGNSQTVNHPTVGRVPGGATVERLAPSIVPSTQVKLQLHQPDFTTAVRISEAINEEFEISGKPVARPENSALVTVNIPSEYAGHSVEFVAKLEALEVKADRPAKVIINERTGTIVMGKEVRVSPVAIMHGNLTVEIQTTEAVSQPGPLSNGTTAVVPEVKVNTKEEKARSLVLSRGATVEELVRALGAIGSTPRDVIAILQSLHAAGALEADIDVI